jgi:phosphohistidine phosphatase
MPERVTAMQVYFLRHADAGAPNEWKGSDFDRPLSAEGTARMGMEAAAIALLRPEADAILTSPLLRARQTAGILAKALRMEKVLTVDERLAPGFGAPQLREILAEHRLHKGILLVGHEPDFSRAISACTGGGRVEIKKGSLVRMDMQDPTSFTGTLVWLLPPRALEPNPPQPPNTAA